MEKVAKFATAPDLGSHSFYKITYLKDGEAVGYGFARADELTTWKRDLSKDGWAVEIDGQAQDQAAAAEPDDADRDECLVCADGPQECSGCHGDDDDCMACGGSGEAVPDHCCDCGGSPYCQHCTACGAEICVGSCSCRITVRSYDGEPLMTL